MERKPTKISFKVKTIKWATKQAVKRKAKGKGGEREKKIEIDSLRLAYRHERKTKKSGLIRSN